MSRLSLTLAAALLTFPASGAPKLKAVPVTTYFPTTVGDRWVTEIKSADRTTEVTEVVTAVEKADGAVVVSIARENNGQIDTDLSRMKMTDKGLFRISNLGTVFTEPYCVLQLPSKPGTTWTAEANRGGATPTTFKYTAGKEEEVEVPAGKFRALRLDVETEVPGRTGDPIRSSIWYAPNVGVVKQERFDTDGGYIKVMKSFKPGK